jgi:hypothetical protein
MSEENVEHLHRAYAEWARGEPGGPRTRVSRCALLPCLGVQDDEAIEWHSYFDRDAALDAAGLRE